ncbi:anhydro-N-acetylmuramic acid kinase [Oryzibacter oryziterrae]|uniref:anhydro-N-acetylmuramic acid kinase n=1 Tax=Oryzibacter oryziterrae TaxID=2766474 RepID=UPI001F00176B|nr:anhydro-N-acetylmuramic acid kinase [Oryzibacter oryziterrae]
MSANSAIWALGLMSGTSFDGVDAALVLTDGESIAEFGPTLCVPYKSDERAILRAALGEARAMTDKNERFGSIVQAETIVTDVHLAAAAELTATAIKRGIRPLVIGFHGQTVFHAPDKGFTAQIGHADQLAQRFRVPVVHDFRSRDVEAGGQGAPLVPAFHRALAVKAGLATPVAFLNIGGVANITIITRDDRVVAFDTGPGNALIDDVIAMETGADFDEGGRVAASGKVDATRLDQMMAHPYFSLPTPKSLDRNAFSGAAVEDLPLADRVATLTALTARSVAAGIRVTGEQVETLVVCGGGAHNQTLVNMLAAETGCKVIGAGNLGLSVDFIEAQAFAYLAVRRLAKLPASWPTTTGVPEPMICGEIV